MESPPLILASSSPRRQQLLREAGYEFRVVAPDPQVECGICSTGGPVELVRELALRKATDVARQLHDSGHGGEVVLLAADTVAECQGHILGKPIDEEDAARMLRLMRGRPHHVVTGICIWRLPADTSEAESPYIEAVVTELRMDEISDEAIDEYIATGGWEGKAGGFGYQDRLGWIHVRHGSESNVVGLPLERVSELLAKHNVFTPDGS